MNICEYFAAPVYPSTKSSYTVRCRTDLEKRLMAGFDSDKRIADYFQPLMTISVQTAAGAEFWMDIDFWIEYADGHTADLIHIQPQSPYAEAVTFMANSMSLDGMFGLIIVRENKLERLNARKIRFSLEESWSEECSECRRSLI